MSSTPLNLKLKFLSVTDCGLVERTAAYTVLRPENMGPGVTASSDAGSDVELAAGAEIAAGEIEGGLDVELATEQVAAGVEIAVSEIAAGAEIAVSEVAAGVELAVSEVAAGAEIAGLELAAGAEIAGSELAASAEIAVPDVVACNLTDADYVVLAKDVVQYVSNKLPWPLQGREGAFIEGKGAKLVVQHMIEHDFGSSFNSDFFARVDDVCKFVYDGLTHEERLETVRSLLRSLVVCSDQHTGNMHRRGVSLHKRTLLMCLLEHILKTCPACATSAAEQGGVGLLMLTREGLRACLAMMQQSDSAVADFVALNGLDILAWENYSGSGLSLHFVAQMLQAISSHRCDVSDVHLRCVFRKVEFLLVSALDFFAPSGSNGCNRVGGCSTLQIAFKTYKLEETVECLVKACEASRSATFVLWDVMKATHMWSSETMQAVLTKINKFKSWKAFGTKENLEALLRRTRSATHAKVRLLASLIWLGISRESLELQARAETILSCSTLEFVALELGKLVSDTPQDLSSASSLICEVCNTLYTCLSGKKEDTVRNFAKRATRSLFTIVDVMQTEISELNVICLGDAANSAVKTLWLMRDHIYDEVVGCGYAGVLKLVISKTRWMNHMCANNLVDLITQLEDKEAKRVQEEAMRKYEEEKLAQEEAKRKHEEEKLAQEEAKYAQMKQQEIAERALKEQQQNELAFKLLKENDQLKTKLSKVKQMMAVIAEAFSPLANLSACVDEAPCSHEKKELFPCVHEEQGKRDEQDEQGKQDEQDE